MKGSVKLPVFIDNARKLVNTTQLRAKYLGASYEAEYCQWQTLHGLGSLMETASLIITPNAYLEGKLLASYPPDPIGDFDVTRATTATRVNSAGLVELVPYNLLQYSQDFSNAAWTKNNVTLTSGQADPFGGTSAFRAQFSGVAYMLQGVSAINGTASIYARSTSGTSKIRIGDTNGNFTTQYTLTTSWQRITTSGSAIVGVSIDSFIDGGWTSQDIQVYGAQLVEGSVAKDYQKTETRLNIPRLDYSNGTCPSILVEPQRTNLVTYSSSFTNAAWISAEVTLTSGQSSPQGINNAFKITGTSATNAFLLQVGIPVTSGNTYTASVYLKGSTSGSVSLRVDSGSTAPNNPVSYTTEWQRFTYTFTAGSTTATAILGGYNTWTGSEEIFVYGFQLEAGSYATSYIPTTSASVTRNADVISKTGISSLIGQTEGTLFAEIELTQLEQNCIAIRLDNGSDSGIHFYFDVNQINAFVEVSGATQASISTGAPSLGTHKLAIAYKANDIAFYVDGVLIGTDTTASIPTCSVFRINGISGGILISAFKVKATSLWKTRLSNTQLAQLTTI